MGLGCFTLWVVWLAVRDPGIAEQQSSSQSRAEEQQWQYQADSVGDEGDKAAGRESQEETCFEDCWAQTAKAESFSGMSLSPSRPFVDQANVLRFGWGARSKISRLM